jgi:hypothetical protein
MHQHAMRLTARPWSAADHVGQRRPDERIQGRGADDRRFADLTGILSAGFVVPEARYVLIPGFGIWAVKTASSGEGLQGAQI